MKTDIISGLSMGMYLSPEERPEGKMRPLTDKEDKHENRISFSSEEE